MKLSHRYFLMMLLATASVPFTAVAANDPLCKCTYKKTSVDGSSTATITAYYETDTSGGYPLLKCSGAETAIKVAMGSNYKDLKCEAINLSTLAKDIQDLIKRGTIPVSPIGTTSGGTSSDPMDSSL